MTRQAAAAAARERRRRFTHGDLPMLLLRARAEGVLARLRADPPRRMGSPSGEWRIVRVLMEQGPLEPRQLVELCCLSSPSLAGILARMDELKLVARERIGHDQRRVRVSLTPASRRLAERMAPQIEAAYRRIESHIGADFTARFYRTLDELIAMMDEPALTGTSVLRTPEFALGAARRLHAPALPIAEALTVDYDGRKSTGQVTTICVDILGTEVELADPCEQFALEVGPPSARWRMMRSRSPGRPARSSARGTTLPSSAGSSRNARL